MSGKLVVKYAFGINPQVKNSVCYSDDHHVLYTSGHQIVSYNIETKEQSFIQLGGSNQAYASLGS
jgi:hypothetical protein